MSTELKNFKALTNVSVFFILNNYCLLILNLKISKIKSFKNTIKFENIYEIVIWFPAHFKK